jgi:hypothetical protein
MWLLVRLDRQFHFTVCAEFSEYQDIKCVPADERIRRSWSSLQQRTLADELLTTPPHLNPGGHRLLPEWMSSIGSRLKLGRDADLRHWCTFRFWILEKKLSDQLRPYLIFWGLGLIAFSAEYLFPARNVPYRAVFFRDLVALGVYNLSFLLVLPVSDRIPIPNYVPTSLMKLPLVYKLILFYVVEDFGLYWVHRLMHTKPPLANA